MYQYKQVTTIIKKNNLMNFKVDNHLNKSAYTADGYRANVISGRTDKEGNYHLTVLYEKLNLEV